MLKKILYQKYWLVFIFYKRLKKSAHDGHDFENNDLQINKINSIHEIDLYLIKHLIER